MDMHKIVYNQCFGGFSLSLEAVSWLAKHATDSNLLLFIKKHYTDTPEAFLGDVVGDWFDDKRHHSDLVAVVENLGSDRASGSCARLGIDYITGNQYRIESHDGFENVVTPDSDWIFIRDRE